MTGPLSAGDHYVALGSSFAAGPGIRPHDRSAPRRAMRSRGNYPHLVAQAWGLRLTDMTFSGATADGIAGADGRPCQLDAVTAQTRLVTVTCGGNDVGYIGGLTLGAVPGSSWVPPLRRGLSDVMTAADARFAVLPETFDRLFGRVRERAPQARLVVVDYLTILPPPGQPVRGVSRAVADWGRETAQRLARTTGEAAARAGATLVPASERSVDHHAWSAAPWTSGRTLRMGSGSPFHPNRAGMAAAADLVTAALGR
ncbi:SGNH/GDSL hydrolase family protein [Agilicoccus flavus]|uniref:SGNH/GDSL hydrolase family protein n=1 Tax=Agilicoccus flavus TaxID=2775968 RepID=UPI001CF6969B|nr:SGNH/GDSL hydrolase family protein [Agilicoccus flavus]